MEDDAIVVHVALVEINCGCCGGTYAINKNYKDQCYKKGTSWACPYCKVGWGYTGNGELQQLQKKLAAERAAKEEAQARAATAEAAKKAAETSAKRSQTQLKNVKHRVAVGTCPCCQRTFKQLAAHMKNKHPDFVPEGVTA